MKKIIHIDMDCFFAAIEIRDNPTLACQAIAVGGQNRRSVLTTCNYIARQYGIHSGMKTSEALQRCSSLTVIPVNLEKYRAVSKKLNAILLQYSNVVEMISLDEAYIDVSGISLYRGSATLIAQRIKDHIKNDLHLIASAGAAPNKFLAKIASDWEKPDGLCVISPDKINEFITNLPIEKIPGVGKVLKSKLHDMRIHTCSDLQKISLYELRKEFGMFGVKLYERCRAIDDREVTPNRAHQMISVEITFDYDVKRLPDCLSALPKLLEKLNERLKRFSDRAINKQFIKLKFTDFSSTTVERKANSLDHNLYADLIQEGAIRKELPIRLVGIGVKFDPENNISQIPLPLV